MPAGNVKLAIVVPNDAITGPVGVVGDPQGSTHILQIVPTVTSIVALSGNLVRVSGKGLIEGASLYRLGDREILDGSVSTSGADVSGTNDTATITLPPPISGSFTVTTAGGTSAPISVGALLAGVFISQREEVPPTEKTWQARTSSLGETRLRDTDAAVASLMQPLALQPDMISGLASPQMLGLMQAAPWLIREVLNLSSGTQVHAGMLRENRDAAVGWFVAQAMEDLSTPLAKEEQSELDRLDLLSVVLNELKNAES